MLPPDGARNRTLREAPPVRGFLFQRLPACPVSTGLC